MGCEGTKEAQLLLAGFRYDCNKNPGTNPRRKGRKPQSEGRSPCMHMSSDRYLGEEFSLFRVLRWKREGAKHTARLVGVIWFSFTAAVTSLKK